MLLSHLNPTPQLDPPETQCISAAFSRCNTLLGIGQQAYADKHFLVAYHALCAALQCAIICQNATLTAQIEFVARAHYDQIEELNKASLEDKPTEYWCYQSLVQKAIFYHFLLDR